MPVLTSLDNWHTVNNIEPFKKVQSVMLNIGRLLVGFLPLLGYIIFEVHGLNLADLEDTFII